MELIGKSVSIISSKASHYHGNNTPLWLFLPCHFQVQDSNRILCTLWCLIEDPRLVFGTTRNFPGVLVLKSCFSVKWLACLVFHPGFELSLLAS